MCNFSHVNLLPHVLVVRENQRRQTLGQAGWKTSGMLLWPFQARSNPGVVAGEITETSILPSLPGKTFWQSNPHEIEIVY